MVSSVDVDRHHLCLSAVGQPSLCLSDHFTVAFHPELAVDTTRPASLNLSSFSTEANPSGSNIRSYRDRWIRWQLCLLYFHDNKAHTSRVFSSGHLSFLALNWQWWFSPFWGELEYTTIFQPREVIDLRGSLHVSGRLCYYLSCTVVITSMSYDLWSITSNMKLMLMECIRLLMWCESVVKYNREQPLTISAMKLPPQGNDLHSLCIALYTGIQSLININALYICR